MRKAVLLFSAFLFFCTSLLLGCVITLKQIKEQGMSELVISHVNLEAPLREALEKIPGGFLVEKPIMQQLDTLQENLMKRKDWTQFLDTAGMAFLQSVAQPDAQLPDLNRQFSELLSTDKDTLFQNTSLSDTEQALLLQVLTKQLNLNSRLQTLAKETRASLTPSAILGIRFFILWLAGVCGTVRLRCHALIHCCSASFCRLCFPYTTHSSSYFADEWDTASVSRIWIAFLRLIALFTGRGNSGAGVSAAANAECSVCRELWNSLYFIHSI
ncbi:MAG: hypothetical protein ACLUQK_09185 [Clostridium sp.]